MKIILCICLILIVFDTQAQIVVETGQKIADITPYYCTIRRHGDMWYGIWAIGTIISSRHVLTAASEVVGYGSFDIGVGSNRHDQLLYYLTVSSFYHPHFMKASRSYNFAILLLEHSLTFNAFTQPIALPPLTVHGPQVNEQGGIVDFGTNQNVLKKTYQRVFNDDACGAINFFPEESKFCAGDEYFNSETNCFNRSAGTAFVVQHFGVDTIMGVSMRTTCSNATMTEYARITSALDWIHEAIGN